MREKILAVIEESSGTDTKDSAVLLEEGKAAVASGIAEVEREHIICGYYTLINWDNTNDEKIMTLIGVKVVPQRGMGFDKITERIYQYSGVEAVYLMSGAYDFIVFIKGKTIEQVALFMSNKLSPTDSIPNTATHLVLKKYKGHGTILAGTIRGERMLITP